MSLRNLVIFVLPMVAHLKFVARQNLGNAAKHVKAHISRALGTHWSWSLSSFPCMLFKIKIEKQTELPPKSTTQAHLRSVRPCLLHRRWVGSMESRNPAQFPCFGKQMALFSAWNAQERCLRSLPCAWDTGEGAAVPRALQVLYPGAMSCSALLTSGTAPLSQFPSQPLILGCSRCLSVKSFICTLQWALLQSGIKAFCWNTKWSFSLSEVLSENTLIFIFFQQLQ